MYKTIIELETSDQGFKGGSDGIGEIKKDGNDSSFFTYMSQEEEISGWYYDRQRTNPLTSVRLLANTRYDSGNGWLSKDNNNPYVYLLVPCTSILAEDFAIQVNNTWTDVGSDPIGDLVNGITNTVAPYAGFAFDILDKMDDAVLSPEAEEKINDHWITKNLYKGIKKASEFRGDINAWLGGKETINGHPAHDKIDEILNGHLMMRGAQFSYYGGSGVDFSNLNMRFTVFPKFDDKEKKFISVQDQLKDLYPYFVGQLSSTTFNSEAIENTLHLNPGTAKNINNYFYLQTAPAGYQATIAQNVYMEGKNIKGTFELQFGGRYRVNNLLASNAGFVFSKQLVKDPTNSEHFTPLFCDVSLSFRPCTKYTADALEKFVGYTNNELNLKLSNKLDNARNKLDE